MKNIPCIKHFLFLFSSLTWGWVIGLRLLVHHMLLLFCANIAPDIPRFRLSNGKWSIFMWGILFLVCSQKFAPTFCVNTRCPSFKRTLLKSNCSWSNEKNFTNFLQRQEKLDNIFMLNFQVRNFKIACFIRYLVKADRNEKSFKAKRSHTLTISWKLEACCSISSILISSKLGTSIVYGMPQML